MERQYVMGVSAGQHGSAALLCDGRVVVAIDEQRIDARDETAAPGAAAVRYCLDSAAIEWDDVALLVESEVSAKSGRYPSRDLEIPDQIRRVGIPRHLAHAYCAATASTFHDATVAVLCLPTSEGDRDDRETSAPRPSCLYGLVGGRLVTPPERDTARAVGQPWALVDLYQQVTTYLFGSPAAGDRLAALAAHGEPGGFAAGQGAGVWVRDGQVVVAPDILDSLDPGRSAGTRDEPVSADLRYYADVARWAQDLVGDALVELLRTWHARYPSPNLVFAGDLTCNTALNRRIASETPFEQVFLQPVAGDPGAAVGCCHHGWAEVLEGTAPPQHESDLCFGHRYAGGLVSRVAGSAAADPGLTVERPDDLVERVAALLAADRTVGWFEGGGELGSLAFGHRSVLSGAWSPDGRERLTRLTGRPGYAAPAVIVRAEDCADVFDLPDLSRHQLLSARIRSAWVDALPAAAYADGTAVVQCVTGSSHRRLHQLLAAFARLKSPPVLLNERLGRFDGPLVETPEEALAFLVDTPLDALVLDDHLIRKADRG